MRNFATAPNDVIRFCIAANGKINVGLVLLRAWSNASHELWMCSQLRSDGADTIFVQSHAKGVPLGVTEEAHTWALPGNEDRKPTDGLIIC